MESVDMETILKGMPGTKEELAEVVKSCRASAEKGDAQSQCVLGILYELGIFVRQDFGLAYKWYKEAADKGSVAAKAHLGFLYFGGFGVKQDRDKARDLFLEAAAHGDEFAIQVLKELNESNEEG